MLSRRLVLFVGILASCLGTRLVAQTPQVDLIIRGGQRFDTQQGMMLPNPGLAVDDGRFIDLAAAPELTAATTLELQPDEFILPGLIDCHAHYNVRLIDRRREEFEVMPVIYLANGATVTFSCGEFDPESMFQLRRRIESGEQIGPRLINSGPYFGRARPGWRGTRTAQEIHDEIDFWVSKGIGGIKVKAIGPEDLQAVIERAHHHGLTVTGHLDSGYRGSVNPADAIAMGIDRIEHFLGGAAMPATQSAYASLGAITADMPEYQEVVDLYLQTGTVFDATLTAYGYFGSRRPEYEYWIDERQFFTPFIQQRVLQQRPTRPSELFEKIYLAKQKTIGEFHRRGGTITLGTDHVSDGRYLPGFGLHRELEILVRSGIPPADALRIGTLNGARALGIDGDHGSIEVGKVADLFIVQGNPLEDIRHSRRVKTVVRGGQPYLAAELLESVRGRLGPRDASEMEAW